MRKTKTLAKLRQSAKTFRSHNKPLAKKLSREERMRMHYDHKVVNAKRGEHRIKATLGRGSRSWEVGQFDYTEVREGDNAGKLFPAIIDVSPSHRKKGIATRLYRLAERKHGQPVMTGHQSEEGRAFRARYDSGKRRQGERLRWGNQYGGGWRK